MKMKTTATYIILIGIFSLLSAHSEDLPDGMALIPAGEFKMGSRSGDSDCRPVHKVYLDAFYIDKHEVTLGQYKKFVKATGREPLPDWVSRFSPTDQHPVVGVSWHDAMAYAQWIGKRLPTEAEWEKAARGGLTGKKFPWGNDKVNGKHCNFADKNSQLVWAVSDKDDGYEYTAPVGSYSPNKYGLYDIVGNAAEWCLDEYQRDFYKKSPARNPIAGAKSISELLNNYKDIKTNRVIRGGSWGSNPNYGLRVFLRNRKEPELRDNYFGFRCVSSKP